MDGVWGGRVSRKWGRLSKVCFKPAHSNKARIPVGHCSAFELNSPLLTMFVSWCCESSQPKVMSGLPLTMKGSGLESVDMRWS